MPSSGSAGRRRREEAARQALVRALRPAGRPSGGAMPRLRLLVRVLPGPAAGVVPDAGQATTDSEEVAGFGDHPRRPHRRRPQDLAPDRSPAGCLRPVRGDASRRLRAGPPLLDPDRRRHVPAGGEPPEGRAPGSSMASLRGGLRSGWAPARLGGRRDPLGRGRRLEAVPAQAGAGVPPHSRTAMGRPRPYRVVRKHGHRAPT